MTTTPTPKGRPRVHPPGVTDTARTSLARQAMTALIAFTMLLAYAAHDGTEYQCSTDTECEIEIEEARKCLVLCN